MRRYFIFVTKKCRIYAAFGVSQTPFDAIMKGEEPEINDTESYDNGTGVIPTYLCDPVVVTIDNYKETLIDSGYYTEDQIQ